MEDVKKEMAWLMLPLVLEEMECCVRKAERLGRVLHNRDHDRQRKADKMISQGMELIEAAVQGHFDDEDS